MLRTSTLYWGNYGLKSQCRDLSVMFTQIPTWKLWESMFCSCLQGVLGLNITCAVSGTEMEGVRHYVVSYIFASVVNTTRRH
jgi:hypothetical protein